MKISYKSQELRALLQDPAAARQAYIYMRKKAKERLSRLERGGMAFYVDNVPDMKPATGQTTQEIEASLKELNQFMKDPFTKISYVKKFEKHMVQLMRSKGYKEINSGNIRDYNYFMSKVKKIYSDVYPTETHDIFIAVNRLRIPIENAEKHLEYFKKHLEALENIVPGKSGILTMRQVYDKVRYYERKMGYR